MYLDGRDTSCLFSPFTPLTALCIASPEMSRHPICTVPLGLEMLYDPGVAVYRTQPMEIDVLRTVHGVQGYWVDITRHVYLFLLHTT